MVVSAKGLKKEYGTELIFEGVSFHIEKGEKVGIVGPNGAGKTTLLRVLAGRLLADGGTCTVHPEVTLGYLEQQSGGTAATPAGEDRTVREEVETLFAPLRAMEEELREITGRLEALRDTSGEETADARDALIRRQEALTEAYRESGGYTYQSEMRRILTSMAFPEERYDQSLSELSGGEKTRLALAMLLLQKPDMLLLDEPTNHLDIGTLGWLEQYLAGYRGTLLVVSHDRYFLDRICGRILEVENHTLRSYEGNYTAYACRKKELREEELRRYRSFKREQERQEELVRRFKERGTEKLAKRAHSREVKLERMAREEREGQVRAPSAVPGKMKLHFKEEYKSGTDVLLLEGLAKGFGFGARRKELFAGVDLDLKRGERLCLVGANGIGKTTLLRIIRGELTPDAGRVKRGYNVNVVYYDQEQRYLTDSNTVLEELWEERPDMTGTELRSVLGSFLFRGDDVFLPVRALSGGERARLALLKLMMGGGNLLLLDEPTNHLDIASREVFEDALLEFPGTVIIISHDRYLLNKVPTRIAELTADGLQNYLGRYDYYQEKSAKLAAGKQYMRELSGQGRETPPRGQAGEPREKEPQTGSASGSKEERLQKKKEEAKERRLAREKLDLEQEIAQREASLAETEARMCEPSVQQDISQLQELDAAARDDRARLDELYEKWLQYE